MHDTEDVLLVVEHGVTGVPGRHQFAHLADGGGVTDDVDARARHHRVLDVLPREVDDAVKHVRQFGRQFAAFARLLDDVFQVDRGG